MDAPAKSDRSKAPDRKTDFKLYGLGVTGLRWWLRLQYRHEAIDAARVPATGGALIVANHSSFLDIPAVGCPLRRPVKFVARENLVDLPILGSLIRHWGPVLIRRGESDVAALRAIMEALREGELVCLFPEGTRSRDGELQALQRGAHFAARKAGVPVIPAGVAGTFPILPRTRTLPALLGKVVTSYGEPILLESEDGAVERITGAIRAEMQRARDRWSSARGRPYPAGGGPPPEAPSQQKPNSDPVVSTPPRGGGPGLRSQP